MKNPEDLPTGREPEEAPAQEEQGPELFGRLFGRRKKQFTLTTLFFIC